MSKIKFITLLIVFAFYFDGLAQNLNLSVLGLNEKETTIIDSLNYNSNHTNFSSINKELSTIKKNLILKGFIENKLIELKKENDSLVLATIHLQKKISTIKIYYKKDLIDKNLLSSLVKNINDSYFILPIEETESVLNRINNEILINGFPFSQLKLTEIKKTNQNTLEAKLVLKKNQEARKLDNIVIKGYKKFPKSYIKQYLKLKTNTTFNIAEIRKKVNTLNNLRFANNIKEPEILFTKDSTALYLYIEKNKSNAFDGFIGFGNSETDSKLTFNGYLNLDLNNNLNFGESFKLLSKSDQNEQKTFNALLNMPFLFNSPLGSEFELNIFKKDSSFTTTNQSAKIYYQLNYKNTISLGLTSTQSSNLLENTEALTVKDFNSEFYTLNYEYIDRNNRNLLYQIKSQLNLQLGLGDRSFETVNTAQKLIKLESSKILTLNETNSIYLRLNGYKLFSDNFLENELARFGGINSLRGFDENSILASTYGLINTEYRYILSKSIYAHSIIDIAYVENNLINQKEKLYGYGIGLGILTKAGLLRFNYANGKNERQKFKLSNSKIHLSLTTVF